VPRAKARAWESIDFEQIRIEILRLYPDAMLDDLIERHLGVTHNDRKERIRERLREYLRRLWMGLHHRRRPSGKSKLAALRDKAELLAKVHEDLGRLDSDTRGRLQAQASADKRLDEMWPQETETVISRNKWGEAERKKIVVDDMGADRYAWALDLLSFLSDWIRNVRESIERSKPGRPGQHLKQFVRLLRNIMPDERLGRATGHADPSHEELQAFVDDMLAPLCKRWPELLKGTKAGHVHQALTKLE
jgi:hypothetical protein